MYISFYAHVVVEIKQPARRSACFRASSPRPQAIVYQSCVEVSARLVDADIVSKPSSFLSPNLYFLPSNRMVPPRNSCAHTSSRDPWISACSRGDAHR